jgi:16S rRNA G966 N2-methylase RsmD
MSLRIIGGEFGGRVLRMVRGMGTRPLLGQVREAIFNILAAEVPDAFVWDLFAGTGASGIEALSRGAARVLFCEKNGRALDVLRGNLKALGDDAVQRSVVLRADAWDPPVMHRAAFGAARGEQETGEGAEGDGADFDPAELDRTSDAEVAPDIVFLDPPYALVAEDPVKSLARARRLLDRTAKGGCVVFHFEVGALDEDDFDRDLDVDFREWGSTAIAILWRRGEGSAAFQRRREKRAAVGEADVDRGDDARD